MATNEQQIEEVYSEPFEEVNPSLTQSRTKKKSGAAKRALKRKLSGPICSSPLNTPPKPMIQNFFKLYCTKPPIRPEGTYCEILNLESPTSISKKSIVEIDLVDSNDLDVLDSQRCAKVYSKGRKLPATKVTYRSDRVTIKIDVKHLKDLLAGGELSISIVDAYLDTCLKHTPPGVRFCSLDLLNSQNEKVIPGNINLQGIIMLPIWVSGAVGSAHFSAYILNFDQNNGGELDFTLSLFNSFPSWKIATTQIHRLLERTFRTRGCTKRGSYINNPSWYVQRDDVSCGLYVCYLAEELRDGREPGKNVPPNLCKLRKRVYKNIMVGVSDEEKLLIL